MIYLVSRRLLTCPLQWRHMAGCIKKSGLYATVKSLLKDFALFKLSGLEPNLPMTSLRADAGEFRVSRLNKMNELCRSQNL